MPPKRGKQPPPDAIKVALQDDERRWLETYLVHWGERRGPKGQTSGSAMEYVRTDIVQTYLNRFHSDRPEEERKRMVFHTTNTIYWYLRGIHDRQTGTGGKESKRVDVVNLWAKHSENAQAVDDLFASYRKAHNLPAGASIPVDEWRTVTCQAFQELPIEVQSKYRDMAAGLKAENRKNKVLTGDDRIDYAKSFVSELLRFIRKGEEKAGVIVVANVAYEVSNVGALKVTSVSTNSAKSYKKSNAHVDSLVNFGEWLRETENKEVQREKPLPAVYPDRQNENFPLIPQLAEPALVTIGRAFVRDYISAFWQRLRGGGPVPWKAIHSSWVKGEHRFVEPKRMPADCPLLDPSQMNIEQIMIWIEWLSRPQLGIGDESTWFCFKVVLTSNLKPVPESSAAVRKSEAHRGIARVWELEYDGWVKNCQVGGNIQYSAQSLQYEEHLIAQGLAQAAQTRPHWLGLPPRTPSNTQAAISEDTRAFIIGLLDNVAESDRHTVEGLIDNLNKMYALMPAEKANGMWANGDDSVIQKLGLPALLPRSLDTLPEPMDYLSSFWLAGDYFRAPFEVDENATHGHFEIWQHRLLKNGFMHHSESGTLLGGPTGVRWAVLAIIKYLLNVGAVKGKLVSPVPQPEGLSSRRLSDGLWDLSLEWCEAWTAEIQSTISILNKTYEERFSQPISTPLAGFPGDPESVFDDIPDVPEDEDALLDSSTAGPSRTLRPRPKPIPKIDPPVSDDESASHHSQLSEDDPDGSDTFEPSGGEEEEEEEDQSEEEGKHKSAKGKEAVRSKPMDSDEDIRSKFMAKFVKSGSIIDRISYEDEQVLLGHGDLVRPNVAPGPLAAIPLTSHPLGPITRPPPLDTWKGRVFELQAECKGIINEARAALTAILESAHTPYTDEDDDSALHMAAESDTVALPLLAVVCKQRIIWNRAKATWATMQYQLKTFEDLMQRSFQVLPILSACVRSSPPQVSPSLKKLLERLERVSFRVRFVYQELHDLAVLSKNYSELLGRGWDDPSHVLDFSDLQSAVEIIFQWSEDTEAVLKWHEESRQKTWDMRREDLEKSPLPLGTPYRFGNPGPQKETDEVLDWLKRDSLGTIDMVKRGNENEFYIDEQSPGADDEQAQALLKGDNDGEWESGPASSLYEVSFGEQGPKDSEFPPEPKVPDTSTVSDGEKIKGVGVNKRKRSLRGEQPDLDHSSKKKTAGKGAGAKSANKTGVKDPGGGGVR